jgi:hemerythrin-like domain-containing protein
MKKIIKKKTVKERLMGGTDALDLLEADHKEVQKIFKQFKQLIEDDAPRSEKSVLVKKACNALIVHTKLEEEIFYPAVRKAIGNEELMDEAKVEHEAAKELIDQLLDMMPGEELYDAKFIVLGEQVKHHIKEEEGEIFPAAKKAKVDLEGLGVQMGKRKAELQQEMGSVDEDIADEDIGLMKPQDKANITDERLNR